jgi:hypothetical protein
VNNATMKLHQSTNILEYSYDFIRILFATLHIYSLFRAYLLEITFCMEIQNLQCGPLDAKWLV